MRTLAETARHEEAIKRSRFVARAQRCDAVAAAQGLIQRLSDPDASHNCWAYRIGEAYRFSDDGEPAGTAGRPILAAIEGAGLDHVAVVVTRYYGGVKLGAGGLARAYGGSTARCLQAARTVTIQHRCRARLAVAFDDLGVVYPLLERFAARRLEEHFTASGTELLIDLERVRLGDFRGALAEATRGGAQLRVTSTPGSDAA